MLVSTIDRIHASEGNGSTQVCATLSVIEDTQRDFVIQVVTSDGSGTIDVLARYTCIHVIWLVALQ